MPSAPRPAAKPKRTDRSPAPKPRERPASRTTISVRLPARPVTRVWRTIARPAGAVPAHGPTYTVRAGDSLWAIAEAHGSGTAATVAARVAELWQLNEHTIGSGDPDLLAIGTVLRLR